MGPVNEQGGGAEANGQARSVSFAARSWRGPAAGSRAPAATAG